ncbi:hypothetical protein SLS61_000871 [Didymella pomorum]
MHLLQRVPSGDFILSEFYGEQIPDYAILSHTWIANSQEVTFKEVMKGRGKDKLGYKKLRFCADQAAKDGLRYFWVDTCCIDKASSAELQEAINSMFSWYRRSKKCYVYFSDVPSEKALEGPLKRDLTRSTLTSQSRILAFEGIRWFRRGWTLQELLAPGSVEFFDLNGNRIGDKKSLRTDISATTTIPPEVLLGDPSSLMQVDEETRLLWAAKRQTTREEDAAYSLLELDLNRKYDEGAAAKESQPHKGSDRGVTNAVGASRKKRAASQELKVEQMQKNKMTASPAQRMRLDTEENPFRNENIIRAPVVYAENDSFVEYDLHPNDEGEAEDKEQRARDMQAWWEDSITKHMRKSTGYLEVAVLLINWAPELDELKTKSEVEELQSLFRDRFRYNVEAVELNVKRKPQHQLQSSIAQFTQKFDGPGNLLIVYYSGHGVWKDLENFLQLTACTNPMLGKGLHQDAHVNWSKAIDLLISGDVDADVLAILDTSYASNDSKGSSKISDRGTRKFELLTASGLDQTTQAPGPYSFTRSLIDNLKDLVMEYDSAPFSSFHLNQRIYEREQ